MPLLTPGVVYIDEWGNRAPSVTSGSDPSSPPTTPPVGTPTAPPAPSPSYNPGAHPNSVQTAPGYSPDYKFLISNDAGYLAAQAAAEKSKGDAAAQRKQMLQQAIIRYGGLPANFTDQYGDIGQDTLDQAGQNQFSVLAGLARNYEQNTNAFKRGLAARGALQSGDLNYGLDQLETAYGQQRYDAANALGGDLQNALSAYTNVLGQNAQSLSSALQGAEQSVYSNPAYTPVAAKQANYDSANSSLYGQPLYSDDSGNLFDMNGNPFFPNGPTGSTDTLPPGWFPPPTPPADTTPTPEPTPPAPEPPGSTLPGVAPDLTNVTPATSGPFAGVPVVTDQTAPIAPFAQPPAPGATMENPYPGVTVDYTNPMDSNPNVVAPPQPTQISVSTPPVFSPGVPDIQAYAPQPGYMTDYIAPSSYSAPAPAYSPPPAPEPAPAPYVAPQPTLYYNPATGQYQTTPPASGTWMA